MFYIKTKNPTSRAECRVFSNNTRARQSLTHFHTRKKYFDYATTMYVKRFRGCDESLIGHPEILRKLNNRRMNKLPIDVIKPRNRNIFFYQSMILCGRRAQIVHC